jgi:hypothetical protein
MRLITGVKEADMATVRFISAAVALPFVAGLWITSASAQTGTTRLRQWDSNGDGVVTRIEFGGTRAAFNAADWNRDGVLSGDELGGDNRFNLSLEEDQPVGTSGVGSRRSQFLGLDINRDGILNRNEWTGSRATFNRQDLNGDGVITRREYVGIEAGGGAVGDGVTGGLGRQQTRSASQVIVVDPRARWTDTGFSVNAGDVIVINTSGSVQLSDDAADTAGAAGSRAGRRAAEAPLPDAFAGALIGRIGDSAAFGIGNQTVIRAPASGVLYLGVNDDFLGDNAGRFRVALSIR